jgi:hypothetical protein
MKFRTLAAAGAFVFALVSVSANPSLAQGRGQGRGQDKRAQPARQAKPANDHRAIARPIFASRERDVIADYYRRRSGLPPGLAKRQGDLPPGLEKQLQRNGVLPPGLQKKLRPLPRDLERRLDRLPAGYRRGILDRHLIVYRTRTYEIGDTLFDVVR